MECYQCPREIGRNSQEDSINRPEHNRLLVLGTSGIDEMDKLSAREPADMIHVRK